MLVICGASVAAMFTARKNSTQVKSQLLEVYDVQGSAAKARLTVDGKVLFVTDVFIGKNGIGKTGEGDAKTPTGTLRPLSAFGIKPNPGTKMPYTDITPSSFFVLYSALQRGVSGFPTGASVLHPLGRAPGSPQALRSGVAAEARVAFMPPSGIRCDRVAERVGAHRIFFH